MTQFAIHWFWEPDRYSEQPGTPTVCPQCGAPVATVDLEIVCRHFLLGETLTDGTVALVDCPYVATIAVNPPYAQPLAGDPVL